MTVEEVKKAGIDLNDNENYNTVKYSIDAEFDAAGVVIEKYVLYDTSGGKVKDHATIRIDDQVVIISDGGPTYVEPLNALVIRQETVDEEMYMVIYGQSKWLKEFYNVQLIVVNNDKIVPLKDCMATLDIPPGLTLCDDTLLRSMGTLEPQAVKTAEWCLRGDVEGDYSLTATFAGYNQSSGMYNKYKFTTEEDLHVYAGSALKMYIKLPKYSYYNKDYNVQIGLKNMSDKPIYGLENNIIGVDQISKATLNGTALGIFHYSTPPKQGFLQHNLGVAKIKVDELLPGQTAVIELGILDLWKSVYEQFIDAEMYDANQLRLLALLSRKPSLMSQYWFYTAYVTALKELPTEHILRTFDIHFAGSSTEIPYEFIIEDEDAPSNGTVDWIWTNAACNSLRDIFEGRQRPGYNYDTFREEYIYNMDTSGIRDEVTDFISYLNDKLSACKFASVMDIITDKYFVVRPQANRPVKVKKYVTYNFPAPRRNAVAHVVTAASDDAFELTALNGAVPDADGYITVDEETVFRIKANETGREGGIIIKYDDGTTEEMKIRSVEAHECKSTGGYFLLEAPSNGEPGLAARICDTCGEITESFNINPEATAMLSNKNTYADIRVAVEEAVAAGEKTELSLFGIVNVTADVTIPDYIDVLIAPDTVINVKEGCKLIAKGEVKDFSGYNYDLSGNGPVVSATTTTAVTSTTSAASTTTTTATETTTTAADTTTTSVPVSSTTTTSETTTQPVQTTSASGSEGEGTTLPETGYPASFGFIAGLAVLMTLAGAALVIRNRKEEE